MKTQDIIAKRFIINTLVCLIIYTLIFIFTYDFSVASYFSSSLLEAIISYVGIIVVSILSGALFTMPEYDEYNDKVGE